MSSANCLFYLQLRCAPDIRRLTVRLRRLLKLARGSKPYPFTTLFLVLIHNIQETSQIVFREKRLSLKDLVKAVDNNFDHESDLRAYILNRVPKYGENDDSSDNHAKVISEMYTRAVIDFSNPRNGNYLPGFWTMTTHMGFGKRMPALPSGRRA